MSSSGHHEQRAQPRLEWAPRPPGRKRPCGRLLVIALIAIGIAAIIVVSIVATVVALTSRHSAAAAPHPGMPLVVLADTEAAAATASASGSAQDKRAAAFLAEMPTAIWLTPEEHGVDEVGTTVEALLAEARDAEAGLTLVVYGLPERDCGQFSAGGLAPEDYRKWTKQIGLALADGDDVTTIVILEPDSLALAPECGNVGERVGQLGRAIDDLESDNSWVYLDGGHSSWLPVGEMAGLLRQAGVDRVRGFATNVSNYNRLGDEVAYAHALSSQLDGAHAVIDTSRNGAGSNGEWCNPADRLIGDRGGSTGDDIVDLNLWIKPPGESDGTCNGGPAAGTWWPQAAVQLTRDSAR